MEYRNLEIFVHSATDLKEMNLVGKMDPYVSVSLSGDPNSKQKTEVDTDGGKNPKWKGKPMKFVINEDLAKNSNVTLVFKIMAEKPFGDKEVGEVYVPVKDLLEDMSAEKVEKNVSYSVKTPSGKAKGSLNFAYKLGEKFTVENNVAGLKGVDEPVMAYPPNMAAGSSSVGAPGGYRHPPPPQYGAYPQQAAGYGYPPQPPAQGYPGYPPAGYVPPQQPGYGYYPGAAPPAPGPYGYPGYHQAPGYGGYPPQQVVQAPKKKKGGMGGMAMGLGAGLLGGLLIGDMVSDVGEMAAYDSGFADGADFDF